MAPRRKENLCSNRCDTCKHRGYLSETYSRASKVFCNYIIETGRSRGCPAGDKCTKYEEGAKWEEKFVFHGKEYYESNGKD